MYEYYCRPIIPVHYQSQFVDSLTLYTTPHCDLSLSSVHSTNVVALTLRSELKIKAQIFQFAIFQFANGLINFAKKFTI